MDVGLNWQPASGHADLALDGLGLAVDDGLRTAVILSLFCDRRAEDDDELPDGSGDRRGWWADGYSDIEEDKWGSRLWLLSREKQLSSVLARAEEYAEEALVWLVDDGIAASVLVETEWVRQGMMGMVIKITKPDDSVIEYRFHSLWEGV